MKIRNLITKIPLVELAGDQRILIENHLGVLSYCPEEIQIKVVYGTLLITGESLYFLELSREQMVINGLIDNISLLRR